MRTNVTIDAGICGFRTNAVVESPDEQFTTLRITTTCDKIAPIARAIEAMGPLDAYQEISSETPSILLEAFRQKLTGCCAACIVPGGLFKSLQVAARLALPQEAHISIQESSGAASEISRDMK